MNRVLVTGAAGFIGWRTAGLLLEHGFQVTGIDNLNDYYDVRLKNYRLSDLKKHEGFSFHEVDIEEMEPLRKAFEEAAPDAVINLAARAGVRYSLVDPHVYLRTNTGGTLNLLELMRANDVKKIATASTSSLYAGQPLPFTEDLAVNTPISPYAATKKAAEAMSYTYHHLFGLDVSVLRYFTVYGPAGRPDMSPFRFTKWIDEGTPIELFGDGSQSRDFTHVDDIAEGTIRALKPLGYEIINLGGGQKPYSIRHMIGKIENLLGKKAVINEKPFHKADMMETWADITKAKELLGWEPKIGFDEGFEATVRWHTDNRDWIRDIKV
ncbi:MAG: GDP-mannose 4,6-dehydratase [Thermodesulfovibrionales bacterium]|nr:GDP-mannose 4,6-dehydratase [Thermodesulfovibrionales bacterium]